jgi:hypothetical protein
MRASNRQIDDRDHVRIRFGLRWIDDVRMSDVRQIGMRLLIVMAAALVLLVGCDYDDHDHDDDFDDDDFIVSLTLAPSASQVDIRRASGQPFEVIEIGVTPFLDPIFGDNEPYTFFVSGIAWSNGDEFIFEIPDDRQRAFIDPLLGVRVVDVLIGCDCFIDYAILSSEFGRTTLFFD